MEAPDNKNSFVDNVFRKKVSFSSVKKKKVEKGKLVEGKKESLIEKGKEEFEYVEHKIHKFFSIHGLLVIILLLPILVGAVSSYVYEVKYQDRVFNGVKILGLSAGGKTKVELSKELDKRISGYRLKIEGGNQEFTASLSELGITYNKEKMVNDALSYGRDDSMLSNYVDRAEGAVSDYNFNLGFMSIDTNGKDIKKEYKINNAKLSKFLDKVEKKINVIPKDSSITTNGASIKVVPAVFGRKLNVEQLKEKVIAAAISFQDEPVTVETKTWSPKIQDEKAKALAEEADKIASKKVVLTYKDKKYSPTKDVIVSWVTFTRDGSKADWKMFIDQGKMYSYFDAIGSGINKLPVSQKVRVENGTKEKITQKGKNGLIINKASLASQLATGLRNNPEVNLTIPMMVAYYQTFKDYVVVANWAKYIEINISTQTMTAYTKGGHRVNKWSITSGQNNVIEGSNTNTPTGTFLIQGKANDICMPNPPGDGKLCHIHYVSYFTAQGHAIHEAWWRYSFGGADYVYNGSHGCINAPISVAQFIYNWAPIGTPVMIHY